MGIKNGRIYGKWVAFEGATQRIGGTAAQTAPPGYATVHNNESEFLNCFPDEFDSIWIRQGIVLYSVIIVCVIT